MTIRCRPPRAPEPLASREDSTACSSVQRVRLPLPTSARLFTDQLRTRHLKMKSDLPISRFYVDEAAPKGGLCNNAVQPVTRLLLTQGCGRLPSEIAMHTCPDLWQQIQASHSPHDEALPSTPIKQPHQHQKQAVVVPRKIDYPPHAQGLLESGAHYPVYATLIFR